MTWHMKWCSWGAVFGWVTDANRPYDFVKLGPVEWSWPRLPGSEPPNPRPLFWLWSVSRVFLFECGRIQGVGQLYGAVVSFSPGDPWDRVLALYVGDYIIALRWLPAQLPINRLTMSEQRRIHRRQQLADVLGDLAAAFRADTPAAGPMPDFRSNPNLN